jgi:uncharacterized protein YndB with AHSA1/START domain
MADNINRVSDEAVKKATGRGWDGWLSILDKEGARKMSHTEIARLLHEKGYIESAWWCQTVAGGYEVARGLRAVGETTGAGFEIGVTKSFEIPAEEAWRLVTSPGGLKAWLGEVSGLAFARGEKYQTADGSSGEIRSVAPGRRIRLTWQPAGWQKPSTLQLTIVPGKGKTAIAFHQEKLAGDKQREEMRRHWQDVLGELEKLIKP